MSENNVQFYDFGGFRLDLANYRLLEDGEPVPLTQKSFELLQYLIENRARVLKKDELLDTLWEGNYVEEANLTQHIYMLRKALGQKGSERMFIETIPKTGYRFIAQVEEVVDTPDEGPEHDSEDSTSLHYSDPGSGPAIPAHVPVPGSKGPGAPPGNDRGSFRTAFGLIGLCAVLVAAIVYFSGAGAAVVDGGPGSIAVLPFKQISEEKDEKLGLGIADVIIAKLANIDSIAVRPTTSIIRYASGDTNDLFEVGKALNVDYVIEGSIQRENGKVRVTTQLYSVAGKKQVWTETFDEEYTDIFALQDAISERVAQKVALGFRANERSFPFKQYTSDPEAYQAYSTGLAYWSQHTKVGFESAIPHFQKAIEKDPHFALAYAYLADTYAHYGFLEDLMDREKALRLGEEMANKALRLDNECAEAKSAKALVYASRKRGVEAFELMRSSLDLKPNDAHSRHRIAWMYANRGNIEKAIDEMKLALDLDPQSTYLNLYMAHFYYLARKPAEAGKFCDRALEIDPNAGEARWRLLQVLEMEGKFDQLEAKLRESLPKNESNPAVRLFLARVLARKGDQAGARKMIQKASEFENADDYSILTAMALISIGDRESAFREIETAIRNETVELFVLRHDPNLDPLRQDPRFAALISDVEVSAGWRQGDGES
ncbi:MAG: winged helix-turn-helix domain-containing protein [Acidobacteriota bacterium]|nr:MAG: winged helix-turn-helix domain-containing protein [Acidobacteriota bacterium]